MKNAGPDPDRVPQPPGQSAGKAAQKTASSLLSALRATSTGAGGPSRRRGTAGPVAQ